MHHAVKILKLNNKQYWKLEMFIFSFEWGFYINNKVMLKKYGKYQILKMSKMSNIFELDISDIYDQYISLIYIVPALWITAVKSSLDKLFHKLFKILEELTEYTQREREDTI